MKAVSEHRCLTRVISDEDAALEVAQIQSIMSRIQSCLGQIPLAQRGYVANALLNLAVAKLIKEEGDRGAATVLMRLGDVLANGNAAPPAERAIDLSRTNS